MVAVSCRMRDCADMPVTDGFCASHWDRLRTDRKFVPAKPSDDGMICGLCGTPIWVLWRTDELPPSPWTLDRFASPDGRCRVGGGGFTVVGASDAATAVAAGVPLYRTHASYCPRRPR